MTIRLPAPLPPAGAPFVLLEDRGAPGRPALLFAEPREIVMASEPASVGPALARLEAGRAQGLHAAGFLGYELGYVFEPRLLPLLPEGRALPLLWFGLFDRPQTLDPQTLDQAFGGLPPPPPLAELRFGRDEAQHDAAVERVLSYLRAGDCYQVNLTFPVDFRYEGAPLSLYAALRASQPAGHGGIVATGEATILSVSPELFVEVAGGRAVTRPMKGTAARGPDPQADAAAALALAADPKQRAENLMIVDLLRNDLSRISETGSVTVPDLFTVETYPTLHTLTSTVTARLRQRTDLAALFSAMFPCGSVTGAPKLRAMEIIRELEPAPRDIYTGSLGMIAPDGSLRFNVAIRTATLRPDGTGVYGVGGGIVADSQPAAEYAECRLKARVLTDLAEDYGLFETLRWSPAEGYVRLEAHLARLAASAAALDFAFDRAALLGHLDGAAARFDAGGDRRVRFELRRDGAVTVTDAAMPAPAGDAMRLHVASVRVDAGDPFLRHKTTRRVLYERAFAEARAADADDAVFLNREGFVTETTRGNVFLHRDGRLLTPPLAHGLLPGILRGSLLAAGTAEEAPLRLEDLATGGWSVGNCLRGLSPARLPVPLSH